MEVTAQDGENNVVVCEDGLYSTSTPLSTQAPPQHITASQTHTFLTPYKYHGCRAIPEEIENQENIDPRTWMLKGSTSTIRSRGGCFEEGGINSASSPFAYPLIWESHHSGGFSAPSPSGLSSPSHTKRPNHKDATGVFESPVSHKSVEREGSSKVKVRNGSGSSSESSCSRSSCMQQGSTQAVTPSKASSTPGTTLKTVFRTPSDTFSSKVCEGRGGALTPKQSQVSPHIHPRNPFEPTAESFHLPVVSPSLFRQVVSPSQQVDFKFRWSIDQLATLNPANIETSPFNQAESSADPEYEQQAQDAIDRYFTQHYVVPSPWTGSNKAVNLLKMVQPLSQTPVGLPSPHTNTVWCQTELTLPPVLPEAVEEALKPFCTFTQEQWWQGGGSEADEGSNINNSTLRRKLLFNQDELLNVTPMCSPKGTDASDIVSSSSSPERPLPNHHDIGSPTRDPEDVGLIWSSVIVSPYSAVMAQQHPHLSRHPPATPPSPLSTHLRHPSPSSSQPTCHLSHVLPSPILATHHPLPLHTSSVMSLPAPPSSSISPITQHSGSLPVFRTSPQYFAKTHGIISSPDVSPVILQSQKVNTDDRLLSSPNVSPIHLQQFGSEEDKKQHPTSVFSPEGYQIQSHLLHDLPSPDGQFVTAQISRFGSSVSPDMSIPCKVPVSSIGSLAEGSCSRKKLTNHPQFLCQTNSSQLPSPSTSKLNSQPESRIRCEESDKVLDLVRIYSTELEVVSTVVEKSSSLAPHSGSKQDSVPFKQYQRSDMKECMESGVACNVDDRERNERTGLNITQEFSVMEDMAGTHHKHTPTKTTPENKTLCSTGHFSSSPIRDASKSPQESELQNHRFSDSPPVSPILCRSAFQASHPEATRPLDFLHPHNKSLPSLNLSHFMAVGDNEDEKNCTTEEVMVNVSHQDNLGRLAHQSHSHHSRPLSLTLARSSSVCDMETDSQPSIELMGCDDGPSQDTGYQTGSLHATNFSLYNQDTTTNITTLPPPQPTDPHINTCTEKERQNGFLFLDKDVKH